MYRMESTHKFGVESTHKFGVESTHKFGVESTHPQCACVSSGILAPAGGDCRASLAMTRCRTRV